MNSDIQRLLERGLFDPLVGKLVFAAVTIRLLETLTVIAGHARDPEQWQAVFRQAAPDRAGKMNGSGTVAI